MQFIALLRGVTPTGKNRIPSMAYLAEILTDAGFHGVRTYIQSGNTLLDADLAREEIGLNGSSEEVDLLQRKIDALNRKMLELINESAQGGGDIESHEDEFKEILETIELLKGRIKTIQELANSDGSPNDRPEQIQQVITHRAQKSFNMTIPSSAR